MPALDAYLHYRIVDVSTLKELARALAPRRAARASPGRASTRRSPTSTSRSRSCKHYRAHVPARRSRPPGSVTPHARPAARALHRALPLGHALARRASRDSVGSNTRSRDPQRGDLGLVASRSPRRGPRGRPRRAPSSRSPSGARTGTPRQVGLHLHRAGCWRWRRRRRAAPSTRCPNRRAIASISSAALEGDRLERRARDVRRVVPRVRPDDGAARVRIPVRRAQADERGHEIHAAAVGDARARALRRRPTSR